MCTACHSHTQQFRLNLTSATNRALLVMGAGSYAVILYQYLIFNVMKRKKAILISTGRIVIGTVIIGSLLFSLISANAQYTVNSTEERETAVVKDNRQLSSRSNEVEVARNSNVIGPNAFFEVQH